MFAACGTDPVDSNNGSNGGTNNDDVIVINSTTNNGGENSTSQNNTSQNNTSQNNGSNGATNGGSNNGTSINDDCPPEARPVYLVEADQLNPGAQGTLVRFEPPDREFTEIGQLDCPASDGFQPFSMSVDREGTAWVLYTAPDLTTGEYQAGEIFEVSTTDASCEATDYQPGQNGYEVFGMGFVLNNPDNEEETLYIAGGTGPGSAESPRIGYITFPDLTVTDSAEIGGWPEMSGTAAAELWAFFPDPISGAARVSRVVPATGEEVEEIAVDSVITGAPNAWAFAHWGGRFYLFYKSQTDPSTNVFEVQRDGAVEEIVSDTGRYIVGAGVSTCAPLVIQ